MNVTRSATFAVLLATGLSRPAAGQEPQPQAPAPPASPPASVPPAPPAAAPTAPAAVAPAPPAPAAPAPAPAPMPAAAAPPHATPPRAVLAPGEAVVHVAVDYRGAWLETRSFVDDGSFTRTCPAPCDIKLQVQGMEARVVAPGMTTSNAFRFDAGAGSAGVRVDGGSATARRIGIITLAAGIPVALAGMALFAQGKVKGSSGLQVAGIAGLAVGGLSVGVSLPLLLKGTTHVKDAKGSLIALSASYQRAF